MPALLAVAPGRLIACEGMDARIADLESALAGARAAAAHLSMDKPASHPEDDQR